MAILLDQSTRVLVQGATGQLGRTEIRRMQEYGTNVVAGVTPGKAGEVVNGVPVYNSVADAVLGSQPNATCIYVPPPGVRSAALEALEAGIRLLMIATERVPVHDIALILAVARRKGALVVGPNSQGVVAPGIGRLGGPGGDEPNQVFSPGPVGVISRSGGVGTEICWMLSRAGLGQSTYISTGGEKLLGTTFVDLLPLFRDDPETRAVVMFGESGATHEEEAAEYLASAAYPKPVVAMIGGRFVERFPGVKFGHAAALVEKGMGAPSGKITALRRAGVLIAESLEEIPMLVRDALSRAVPVR